MKSIGIIYYVDDHGSEHCYIGTADGKNEGHDDCTEYGS
jgi:hypothetical protein